jgi:hypothetical protein
LGQPVLTQKFRQTQGLAHHPIDGYQKVLLGEKGQMFSEDVEAIARLLSSAAQ